MIVVISAAVGPRALAEIPVVTTENAEIDFGGMVQLLGFAQHLDDPYKNDDRVYLFMNRARLRLSGHYEEVSFYMEMGLGGEDAIVAQTGVSLGLLDFAFNIPLGGGQTDLPQGRAVQGPLRPRAAHLRGQLPVRGPIDHQPRLRGGTRRGGGGWCRIPATSR